MKTKVIVNGIISNLHIITIVNLFVLIVNVLGWLDGASGGLSFSEFISTFWIGIICFLIPLSWYSLGGILLKQNPFKIWSSWFNKTHNMITDYLFGDENN